MRYVFKSLNDVTLHWAGAMRCPERYSYTYELPEGFLLHFVIEGKGVLKKRGKVFPVRGGQAFVIHDGEICSYQADQDEPWFYEWFCCSGSASEQFLESIGVTRDEPIYTSVDPSLVIEQFKVFLDKVENGSNFFSVAGELLKLFGVMSDTSLKHGSHQTESGSYVDRCINFIKKNYMQKIGVSDLTELTRIDPSYLYRLFIQETGIGPKDYITNFKLEKSIALLSTTELPVSDIANLVGYEDGAAYSKIFKKKHHMSPSQWREKYGNRK